MRSTRSWLRNRPGAWAVSARRGIWRLLRWSGRGLFRWLFARAIFASHLWRLLVPTKPPMRYRNLDANVPASLKGADGELTDIVIEEGRRLQDSSAAELEAIRTKAQFAFSTNLLFIGLLAAQLARIHHRNHWYWICLIASAALALLALGGALSVMVNSTRVPIIHPALASHYGTDATWGGPREQLARDYALNAVDWSNINATQRAVSREGALYLTLAAIIDAVVWIALHR